MAGTRIACGKIRPPMKKGMEARDFVRYYNYNGPTVRQYSRRAVVTVAAAP